MPSEAYERVCATHDRIAALYPKVREAKAYRRKMTLAHSAVRPRDSHVHVDRDLIVLSLVTKAVTSHSAVRALTDAGLPNDAMSVFRTLLENVVLLEWLLKEDYRIDLYALSQELLVTRFAQATAPHYHHHPEFQRKAVERSEQNRALVDSVFGVERYVWAKRLSADGLRLEGQVRFADMLDDVMNCPIPAPGKRPLNFTREVSYSMASWSVHSEAPSMQRIAESCSLDPLFALSIERGGDSALTGVLDSANLQGLSAISTIDTYAGLGLDSQIDDLVAEIKAQPR